MNQDTSNSAKAKKTPPIAAPGDKTSSSETQKLPPLFRSIDWWVFCIATLLVFIGYMWTLAPDVTLEDSGELAVGSMYAGVPHPPGYPVWTLFTWFFTKILPFSNIAWRVGVASAVAGAFACGLIALVVSRGSSMMIEGIAALKEIDRRLENAICVVSGIVAGMLMGFNGYMWSQSVIVEVYSLSVLSLMLVIAYLLRWVYEPTRMRYLYWAFFFFGICLTNHMSLLVAAIGIEIAVAAANRRLGRDLFLGNAIVYVAILFLKMRGSVTTFDANPPLFAVFNVIGIGSVITCLILTIKTQKILTEWKKMLMSGLMWLLGAGFYLYMPIASMSNPPMNWGYPRTAEGFVHAIKRGQYDSVRPATDIVKFFKQMGMYAEGAVAEFNLVYVMIGLVPFLFFRFMQKRERAWLIGLSGIFLCLSVLMLVLLNPGLERQSVELHRVFFTASHLIIAIAIGYGLTLIAAYLATHYQKARYFALGCSATAVAFAAFTLNNVIEVIYGHSGYTGPKLFFHGVSQAFSQGDATLTIYGSFLLVVLTVVFLLVVLVFRSRMRMGLALGLFLLMPGYSVLSHWFDNEQRGHLYGYWFGHDMFTLSAPDLRGDDGKPIYPDMARDAVLFGGTDPGRFNPTYMIFCESFIPAKNKPNDPDFDRRDVYLITQNALADNTYLNYIRAHYNRSTQNDPPFFQNFFKTRALAPLDKFFLSLGDKIEKERRVGSSYFTEEDFIKPGDVISKLKAKADPVSKFLAESLTADTQQLLAGGDEKKILRALAEDFNRILESGRIYDAERFKDVTLSDHSRRFIVEDPKGHTRIRWNRLLIEDAYPDAIANSPGGVYPDLEIHTPSPEDSQKCFNDYLMDAEKRFRSGQLKPGEDFKVIGGRVQVSGQVGVMAINGLLTKIIFDKNPGHEFYVEESFPLEWMFPHLTPYGIIMKINRETVPVITEEIVQKDHAFWKKFSERLIGDWITYDTPVTNICEFAEKLYLRHDFTGFKGDRKFIRDDNGQKAFSKLRSSIGGMYLWRLGLMAGMPCPPQYQAGKSPAELARVIKEAEFALKQAFAFCPYSPEAVYRFVQFLASQNRTDEAVAVAETCLKLDPQNDQIRALVNQIQNIKAFQQPRTVEAQTVFNEVDRLLKEKQTNQAMALLDQVVVNPSADANAILMAARIYLQAGDVLRLERALTSMVRIVPDNPEAWYDLAGIQVMQQRPQTKESLRKAIELSNERLKTDPQARDLAAEAKKDARFAILRNDPDIKKLLENK